MPVVEHTARKGSKAHLGRKQGPHSRSSSSSSIAPAKLGLNQGHGFTHKDSPLANEVGKKKQNHNSGQWEQAAAAKKPAAGDKKKSIIVAEAEGEEADEDEWISSESALASPAPEPQEPEQKPRKPVTGEQITHVPPTAQQAQQQQEQEQELQRQQEMQRRQELQRQQELQQQQERYQYQQQQLYQQQLQQQQLQQQQLQQQLYHSQQLARQQVSEHANRLPPEGKQQEQRVHQHQMPQLRPYHPNGPPPTNQKPVHPQQHPQIPPQPQRHPTEVYVGNRQHFDPRYMNGTMPQAGPSTHHQQHHTNGSPPKRDNLRLDTSVLPQHPPAIQPQQPEQQPDPTSRPRSTTPPARPRDRQSLHFASRPHSVHSKRASVGPSIANPLVRLPSYKAVIPATAYLNPTSAQAHLTPMSPVNSDIPTSDRPISMIEGQITESPNSSPPNQRLHRTPSNSSIRSTATLPYLPESPQETSSRRERTNSTFSLRSTALGSLSAIPNTSNPRHSNGSMFSGAPTAAWLPGAPTWVHSSSSTPTLRPEPPLVTHFPPVAATAEGEGVYNLLPKPYLDTHLTVTAFNSPGLESLQRVAMSRAQIKVDVA